VTDASEVFAELRPRLFGVAYRMTGSVSDADDICQDAWLRWRSVDAKKVDSAEAYLVRIVTRLAIDHSRSVQRRRESYVGPYLPEPLVARSDDEPLDAAELADSLTFAFLVLLDVLDPIERAVVLLHDVFDYTFEEVARATNRTSAACRKTASRARRRIHREQQPARPGNEVDERRTLQAFVAATIAGDVDALIGLLAPDIVQIDDSGGTRPAARRPVVGPERVARLIINLARRMSPQTRAEVANINGSIGLVLRVDGRPDLVLVFEFTTAQTIRRIWVQANQEKLEHLRW
jgi:RNA polymerase sigma-70 factor, ECF subfamily